MSHGNVGRVLRGFRQSNIQVSTPFSHGDGVFRRVLSVIDNGVFGHSAISPLEKGELRGGTVGKLKVAFSTIVLNSVVKVDLCKLVAEGAFNGCVEELGILGVSKSCFSHKSGFIGIISVPCSVNPGLELVEVCEVANSGGSTSSVGF